MMEISMNKFNQRYINRIIFSKLFENENERPIPELGSYEDAEFSDPRPTWRDFWPTDLDPAIEQALDQQEREEREIAQHYELFNHYYRQFQEWYRREYPDDNDPGRLQRAWEALQREIQRLIDRGYTLHDIRKYVYRHTDGKHNQNYEDFPDWYHKENWQEYGLDKDKWKIPRRGGQGWI